MYHKWKEMAQQRHSLLMSIEGKRGTLWEENVWKSCLKLTFGMKTTISFDKGRYRVWQLKNSPLHKVVLAVRLLYMLKNRSQRLLCGMGPRYTQGHRKHHWFHRKLVKIYIWYFLLASHVFFTTGIECLQSFVEPCEWCLDSL